MNSYKIYLTRSSEVAQRISKSFTVGDDIEAIEHGTVNEDTPQIPAMYQGFCYCLVTLSGKGANGEHYAPTYELTIC